MVRFAIMGAGSIAHRFCDAVALVEGAEVTAVCSKSPERAADFAAKHNIPVHGTYDEILSSGCADVVYIATTQNFHKENIRACLESGHGVLCEKAMCLTKADAEELFGLAKEKNLFIMEAMWSRFLPAVQWAKKQIEDGKIGDVRAVSTVIGFRGDRNPESRLVKAELGGGAMYDIGVYAFEVSTYLIGQKAENVQAIVRPHPVTGVDNQVSMIVRYPTADAAIQCMFTSNVREYVIVNGTDGVIELPSVCGSTTAIRYGADRREAERFHNDFPGGNGFVYEIEEVVRCFNEGRTTSDIMPPEATIEAGWVYDCVLRPEKN